MLGKNNKVCKMQQAGERFKKYTIKRLSIGVASVAVATGILFGGHAQTVAADDTTTTDQDALKEKAKDQHQQKEVVLGEGAPKTTVTPKATEKPVVKETPKEAAPAQNKQVEKAAVKKADAPKPTTLAAGPQTLKSAPLSTITQPKDYPNVPAIPDTEYIYATFESKNQWYKVYLTVNKANMPDKAVDQTVKVYVVRYDGYVMKNSNATLTPGATYHKVIDGIDLYINNSGQDVSLNSTNEAFYCRYYVSSHGNNSSYSWSVFNPQKVQQKVVYVQDKAKQGEDPSYQPIPGVEQGGVVDGVTGQHYDVNKNAAKVIKGFYLVTEPKLNGTLSQFKEDAEVVQTFYNGSTKTFQVFMKQTDDKGTMSCYYYKNGYKYTFTLAPGTSKYINLGSYQYYIANPYVTQTTKVQFVYAKVGQIVPVDKDGNPIAGINNGDYNKDYDNDQNDPKKVSPTKAPEIPGWKIVNPTQSTITPDKPGQDTKVVYEPIIDKVPVEGDVKQVITIEGLPADQQPNLNGLDKQTVKYKGTKTINHAPEAQGKKAIETIKWDANKTFKDVKVPVVKGFFADKKQVTGDATTPAQIGQTINKKITYKKMGHIIPTFNGKSIFPGVDNVDQPIYNNDANDPTKAAATDSPVIPGYHIKNPAQKTITPAEPGKNTVVEYEADEQKAKIVYIDNTTGKVIDATKFGITNPAEVTGKTAEVINYFPIKTIAKLQSQGFVRTAEDIAKSTWKQGVKFDNDTNKLQEFKVYLSHGETTIRPDDPRNKDDKYDLTRTVKRTIDYKYGAKTVKANKTASPTVTQTVTFERTKTIDTVTKKVIKTSDWTINKDSLKDLAAVVSPTIAGYTPDQAKVGQVTPNADSKDIEVHVIYNADNQKATVTYIDDT
ncbi:mucin-binding protein, partial [Ligilactobacillus ceti]|uniref:mucin-binding protein n=1 Tax=Ligilactobacillus ceti TaxID=395085 RepID=UPI0009E85F98